LYSPTNPSRNYFDCLCRYRRLRLPVRPIMYSPQGVPPVDPGEGVLFSPGNPEGHCAHVT
jgi:hypothetical protein